MRGKEDQLYVLEVDVSLGVGSNLTPDHCINISVKKETFSKCILEECREIGKKLGNSFLSAGGTLHFTNNTQTDSRAAKLVGAFQSGQGNLAGNDLCVCNHHTELFLPPSANTLCLLLPLLSALTGSAAHGCSHEKGADTSAPVD